ncbi:MAG: tetratricopeptide repeat protein, partial [Chitinophagaceae bacterium]
IKIQEQCNASNEFKLRIGIHLGEVVFENDDVFGDGVNIASRIQAIAPPGGIFISEAVHHNVSNKNDINTAFVKVEQLKNVKEPVRIYQVKMEGIETAKPVHSSSKSKTQKYKKLVMFFAGAALIMAPGYFIYNSFQKTTKEKTPSKVEEKIDRSIAVLPFVDMSAGKDQEYFSDGLSEELLNLLAKIPELKVIGRTSSFYFKGKNEDLRSIAEKLGVAHLLEGSVRKDGNKIRVTAQLIKATDGSHLWSETYDRDLKDIFKLQDEIAVAVVKQLKLKLLPVPVNIAPSSTNTEVYTLILQGNYFSEKRDKESLAKALDYYLQALAIDSLNARSWAGLAKCFNQQAGWDFIDRNKGLKKAELAANKAIALDENQTEGHSELGAAKMWNYDWEGAEAAFQKALNLEPGNAEVLRKKAFLYRCLGRFDEAILLTKQSISLDPIKGHTYFNYGQLLYHDNQLEAAIASYKKVLEINPQFPRAHIFLGQVYLLQGKPELALDEMPQEADEAWKNYGLILIYLALGRKQEVDKLLPDFLVKYPKDHACQIAEIYAFRGEKDKAFEWLEKSYLARESRLTYLKGNPLLKNLWLDQRYKALMKKMNLPLELD